MKQAYREKLILEKELLEKKLEALKNEAKILQSKKMQRFFEAPLENKIRSALAWENKNEEERAQKIKEILESAKNLSHEDLERWEDVKIMLESPDKLDDIISVWEDMSRKKQNPKSAKWAEDCLKILSKVLEGKISNEPKLLTYETENKETTEQNFLTREEDAEENREDVSNPEEGEKSDPETKEPESKIKDGAKTEHIPLIKEEEKERKVIVGDKYLEEEIENELREFLVSKKIIPKEEGKLVKIESNEKGFELRLDIKESEKHKGEHKWHVKVSLENHLGKVRFVKFEYEKSDSHTLRSAIEKELHDALEKICKKLAENHAGEFDSKKYDTKIEENKLEIIIKK